MNIQLNGKKTQREKYETFKKILVYIHSINVNVMFRGYVSGIRIVKI